MRVLKLRQTSGGETQQQRQPEVRSTAMTSKRTLSAVLLGALLIAVAGAGYASRKYKHTSGYAGGAHTIFYRIEYFQEDGSPAGIGFVARQVKSDGSWRNVTTLPDGKTGS